MDAGSGQSGTAVTINDCTGGNGQKWTANANGTITNAQAGACLDASGRGTADNTPTLLTNGQVILMHDGPANTVAALPRIAQVLAGHGLCAGMISPRTGRAVAPS